ncbi:MAG TPA: cytochrome c oxidase subunit II [Acidimicrobiia bacterium]
MAQPNPLTGRAATRQPHIRMHRRLRATGIAASTLVLGACAGAGPQTSLEPKGDYARGIDGLWDLVFWLAVGVFVVVQALLLVAIFRFRQRKGDDRQPRQLHGNTRLEIGWTILPAVILAIMTVPTVRGIFVLRDVPDPADVLDIQVTGHQWWWEFEYVESLGADGRALHTANELHIPADTEVYLSMSSADVIHSFWVPPLNGKRDVVPGKLTNLHFEADEPTPEGEPILGQCAEFCGLAHADMRIRVYVHTAEDYAAWVASQLEPAAVPAPSTVPADAPAPAPDTIEGGWATFDAVCTACHQASVRYSDGVTAVVGPADTRRDADGADFHIALAPDLSHFGSRTTFAGATVENVPEHLAEWLANPPSVKPMDPARNDVAAGRILGMPDFGLSDEQIAGLIALLESWR